MFNSSYIAKKHFNFFYLYSLLRLLVFYLFCINISVKATTLYIK